MSTYITSFPLGGVLFQSGFGVPNHLTPKGSLYVDLNTAIEYINKDGFTNWVEYLDSDYIYSNFLSVTGGTVSGSTIFLDGLTANTISSTTFTNISSNISGLTTTNILSNSISANTLFTNSISATTYYNLPIDVRVTGGTFSNATDILTFTNNTGGTFTVTGLTDYHTTGTTRIEDTVYYNTNNVLSAYTSYAGLSDINNRLLINDSSTGLIAFGGLSVVASATTYSIGAIKAWFVDNTTNPSNPSKTYVEFSATSGNTLINLTGQNVTYIAINSGGTITQQGNPFTSSQQRDLIHLGVIVHSNRLFINAVNNQPIVASNPLNQFSDLVESLNTFNFSGNTISANGNNLSINKSIGQIFKQGVNFINNPKDPHILTLAALTAPSNIRYRLQNGSESLNTAFIDPNNYDVSGVTTTVPDTKYTVQRIYLFQSNLIRIQYGQHYYDSLDDANSKIIKDIFNVEQNLIENGLLIGILIVKKGVTNLNDTNNVRFLNMSRFGNLIETNLGSGLFRGEILNNSSTGLINGGLITFASSSSVNVSAGSGRIINNTNNPDLPTLTQVNWSATTGLTITNLTGQSGTVLFVTSAGTITQQNITSFTNSADFRDKIYIGGVGHPTGTITALFNNPMAIINPVSQLNDLNQSIGPFSINGNKLSKLTGTLKLFKSSGKSYFSNANYQTDNTNPSIFNVSSFSAGTLSYVTQTSFLGFISSDINTTQYDNGGVLTIMGNNNFVAHRIWHQPSNNIIFFQYGQAEYSTLSEARSRFTSENFVTPSPLEFGAYLIGVILVRKGETNLDDPTRSEIIVQGKFAGSGTGSGGAVDTLQSAYDNSTSPEIRTDSTRGALTIRNSAGTDTLNIIEGQNLTGGTTSSITGAGNITGNSFIKTNGLSTDFLKGDGSVDTNTYAKILNNLVVVKTTADFPTPVAGVITLSANTSYQINGSINLGTNRIQLSTSNLIFGTDKSSDKLIYTGTSSMITGSNNDFTIRFITVAATTSGGTVFNISGSTNKLEINNNVFGANKSLGTIVVGDLLVFRDNLFSLNTDGLTVNGNNSTSDFVFADNYIADDNIGTFKALKLSGGTFNQILISRNSFRILTGQTAVNYSTITLTNGNLSNNSFNGTGTYLSGLTNTTTNWLFIGNQGIGNKRRELFMSSSDMVGVSLSTPTTAAAALSVLTNTGARFLTFRGGNGQDDGASVTIQIPNDYFSNPIFDFNITTDTTVNNVKIFMGISKIPIAGDFGTLGETGLNVVTAGVTQYLRKEVSITPITTTFSGGDVVVIKVWRDPDDAADTATGINLYLNNMQFRYDSI